jgi:hypothetical protein
VRLDGARTCRSGITARSGQVVGTVPSEASLGL